MEPNNGRAPVVAAASGVGQDDASGVWEADSSSSSVSALASAATIVALADSGTHRSGDARDPEAGLPPAPENEASGRPARARRSRWTWGRVVHWAVGPRPHPQLMAKAGAAGGKGAAAAGSGWTDPDGDRRSEEQVFRALLCLLDAGQKKRPTIARGKPGHEAEPMRWYYLRHTLAYSWFLGLTWLLYISISLSEVPDFDALMGAKRNGLGGPGKHWRFFAEHPQGKLWYELLLESACIVAFAIDIVFQALGSGGRYTLSHRWTQIFIACLLFDVIGMLWPVLRVLVVSGIVRFYPIVYYNYKARNALLNYIRALPSVLQWIASELFLITVYACACVLLFSDIDRDGRSGQTAFLDFGHAFISLFALSMTVNNPDVYMPYYRLSFWNGLVFASFLILAYFTIHNIILSRIFQIYTTKLKQTAINRNAQRQDALSQAFDALDEGKTGRLPRGLVAHVLRRLKPHYSEAKLQTIMFHSQKDNPDEADTIDFDIDQFSALMISVVDDRLHRIRPAVAHFPAVQRALDLLAVAEFGLVVVAIAKFRRVFYSSWVWWLLLAVRGVFTADLAYRAAHSTSAKHFLVNGYNKLSIATLLLALASGACMIYAIFGTGDPGVLHPGSDPESRSPTQKLAGVLGLVVVTLDVCGVTARLPEYAALLRVAGRLFLPAFLGQAAVIFTLFHVFTYMGMYCFGGRVGPSNPLWAEKQPPQNLFYLMNFNTYKEGMMTLFQLLVVNDWNIISANFVQITQTGWSYVYFMLYHVMVTMVGLSCVTSFFISHLSARLEEELEHQRLVRLIRKCRKQGHRGDRRSDRSCAKWARFWPRRPGGQPSDSDVGAARLSPLPPSLQRDHPSTPPPQRYRMERRLSSGFLVLAEDEPVNAAEYRCLLEAMTKESGDRTGYCFVKPPQTQPEGPFPHPLPYPTSEGRQEQLQDPPAEVILKSALFSKIVSQYAGDDHILRLCGRVFARESSRRERGLASIVGSETLADVSVSAAVAAAAAAAAMDAGSPRRGLTRVRGGLERMLGAEGEDAWPGGGGSQQRDRDTHFCIEEIQPHPSVLGLQLYLKFFFITERESIFSYVHVEEEQVGEVTAGLGQGERGEETAGGVGMRAQRRQQSVGGVLRLTAADDDGDSGRDPLCLD